MWALAERSSISLIMARHPAMPVPIRMLSDRISEAYKSAALRKQPQSDVKGGTGYATKVTFDTQVKSQRTHGADAETGVKPTNMQKRFLIMTRLFKSKKDIPEYVAPGTMDRMHDRLRVVFIARSVEMGIFRKVFMNAAGIRDDTEEHKKGSYEWKKQHLTPDQVKLTMDNEGRYSGIPAIPSDIGYSSGKETGGKKKSGVVSQVASNPGVILGMGLTTLALLGMFRSSFVGDKLGAQKYMQYRIMAQFFTVTALVAGVTFFGATYEDEEAPKSTAILHKH